MLVVILGWVFVLGTVVGSLLNVCVYRLPLEKSILWPGSRCSLCLQPIRWYDNIPLLSYLWLRGKCRTCGVRFSIRYFLIELLTGLSFAGIFYLDVVANVHQLAPLRGEAMRLAWHAFPSVDAWIVVGFHCLFLSLLIVATFCDLDHREIPLSLTLTGTVIGLCCAVLFPWPWPSSAVVPTAPAPVLRTGFVQTGPPVFGLYPWPPWWELPSWLPPGSVWLGLATGVAGLLFGTLMMRVVRFVFTTGFGVEALGLGDADLMMMGGAFLGWQPLVLAFFLSVGPGLAFALIHLFARSIAAHRRSTCRGMAAFQDGHTVLVLDGEVIGLAELESALAHRVQNDGKRSLLLRSDDLEQAADAELEKIREQVKRAGVAMVIVPAAQAASGIGWRRRIVLWLFGSVTRPTIKLEVPALGCEAVLVNNQPVPFDQLAPNLEALVRAEPGSEVSVETAKLDHWLSRTLAGIRLAARQAGMTRILTPDSAVPFGPGLAVGLAATMIGWEWFRPRLQPLFFDRMLLILFGFAFLSLMLVLSYVVGLLRRMRTPDP
jgi:leader peptidase (prepilin peptidase)/N-methyltransferase